MNPGLNTAEHKKTKSQFAWQDGFGGFSVSKTQLDAVYKYIQNQEEHHEKITFREEYLKLLKKNDVDFEEKWIFQDLA